MKEIQLTRGFVAQVSNGDYKRVLQHRWHVVPNNWGAYARSGNAGYMHRFILNPPKNRHIDHIDGNGLNNQRENLRILSNAENARAGRLIRSNNKSGYRGVFFEAFTQRWVAKIMVDYKSVTLGRFPTKEEAALAYNESAKKHFGDFARLNVVGKIPPAFRYRAARKRTRFESKYRGVSYRKDCPENPWYSIIVVKKERIHVGCFPTEKAAAQAYNKKAVELKGNRAVLNMVKGG